MKEKQVYKKIWPLPVKNFKKFFLWHQAVHLMNLTVDRHLCVIKTVAYSLRTDGRTDGRTDRRTDKNLKTEGPMKWKYCKTRWPSFFSSVPTVEFSSNYTVVTFYTVWFSTYSKY